MIKAIIFYILLIFILIQGAVIILETIHRKGQK
jgi:hypothetical protein